MDIDTKRLRELAQKATQGTWIESWEPSWETADVVGPDGDAVAQAYGNLADGTSALDNARYISFMDPTTVLALLDQLDRAEQALRLARETLLPTAKCVPVDASVAFLAFWRAAKATVTAIDAVLGEPAADVRDGNAPAQGISRPTT